MVLLKLTSCPGGHSVQIVFLTSYVTSGKLLYISEPQFSHLKNGNIKYMAF